MPVSIIKRSVIRHLDTIMPAVVILWVAAIAAVVLTSGGGQLCNPDAVSVFTNQRECRQLDHVPMGPRIP